MASSTRLVECAVPALPDAELPVSLMVLDDADATIEVLCVAGTTAVDFGVPLVPPTP